MYQLLPKPLFGESLCIFRIADNTFIPIDPANGDYQQYLEWLAEGNTVLPAEE